MKLASFTLSAVEQRHFISMAQADSLNFIIIANDLKLFSDLTDQLDTIYSKITLCAPRHPFTVFVATTQPSPRCLFVPPLKDPD